MSGTLNGALSLPGYLLALLRELSQCPRALTEIIMPKQVRKTNLEMFLVPFQKKGSENRSSRFEPKNSWLSFSRGSGPTLRTIKEYQLENCGIFEPPPFCLSRIVRDEWTAWHKLWQNLEATENQIQCLILLDVEARIHEEAEEIEVWSPSYPRSLQTVWIGNNKQSVGQMRIHYSNPTAEILSSTHRAPWTRARMCTIQGHEAFENA